MYGNDGFHGIYYGYPPPLHYKDPLSKDYSLCVPLNFLNLALLFELFICKIICVNYLFSTERFDSCDLSLTLNLSSTSPQDNAHHSPPSIPSGFPIIDLSEHPRRPDHYPLTMEDLYCRTIALEVFRKEATVKAKRFDYSDLTEADQDMMVSLVKPAILCDD